MPKRGSRQAARIRSHWFENLGFAPAQGDRNRRRRCAVCRSALDSPVIAVKTAKGPAHLLCAGLDKIGLGELARTSGR